MKISKSILILGAAVGGFLIWNKVVKASPDNGDDDGDGEKVTIHVTTDLDSTDNVVIQLRDGTISDSNNATVLATKAGNTATFEAEPGLYWVMATLDGAYTIANQLDIQSDKNVFLKFHGVII